jgi:hypothetical protein
MKAMENKHSVIACWTVSIDKYIVFFILISMGQYYTVFHHSGLTPNLPTIHHFGNYGSGNGSPSTDIKNF